MEPRPRPLPSDGRAIRATDDFVMAPRATRH